MLGFINMEITIKLRYLSTTVLVRKSRNSNPLDLYPSAYEQSNRYSKVRVPTGIYNGAYLEIIE